MPPAELVTALDGMFLPAPEVDEWLRKAFLTETSPLYNVEHDHLNSALLGILWTNVSNVRQMRKVAGMVELPKPHPALGKWAKARQEMQLRNWFGTEELDFLITLDAEYAAGASDVQFCALVEHELYHCAHKLEDGCPAFYRSTGKPKFTIKGHDVEEFVGIVRRYGVGAAAGDTIALVAAAQSKPEIAPAEITSLCGLCVK